MAAQAVGGIAGGFLAAAAGDRIRASRLLGWGAMAFGAIDLAMFLYPLAWIAVWRPPCAWSSSGCLVPCCWLAL